MSEFGWGGVDGKKPARRIVFFPRMSRWLSIFAFLCVSPVWGASAVRKAVPFEITRDVGLGNEVCVLGSHPQLGGGNVLKALKLAWTPGNVWKGTIALEAGETLTYRFISRSFAVGSWGNPALRTDLTGDQTVVVPSHPAPPWGRKTVFLHSTWSEAIILYRDLTHNGAWTEAPMTFVGPGRTASEKLYRVEGLVPCGAEMEFVFRNASNVYLNAPAPPASTPYQSLAAPYNFRTTLDVFFVQDQQVFNYRPPASVSAPRSETRQVASTVASIPGRPITIILPRGYNENSSKRYPVVYFHDGQNVFFPGGPFGTWDADRIAAYETSQGRMREAILVAIPNGNAYGSDRLMEYLPNGDTITNYGGNVVNYPGRASAYVSFLLDNVAPTLDVNYRTLGDAANTAAVGSSMGGLVSDFIALNRSDRFGAVGIFSPAYWAAPNYVSARDAASRKPVRRFVSMGTAESSTGESSSNVYWQGALQAYNAYVRLGHPLGRELRFEGVAGGAHNEATWAGLLPGFYAFALDPWLEAQPLALETYPPRLDVPVINANTAALSYTARYGFSHTLQSTADLGAGWSVESPLSGPVDFWESAQALSPVLPRKFWRLQVRGW